MSKRTDASLPNNNTHREFSIDSWLDKHFPKDEEGERKNNLAFEEIEEALKRAFTPLTDAEKTEKDDLRRNLRLIFKDFYALRCDIDYLRFVGEVFVLGNFHRLRLGFDTRRGMFQTCLSDITSVQSKLAITTATPLKRPLGLDEALRPLDPLEVCRDIDEFLDSLKIIAAAHPLFSLVLRYGSPRKLFNDRGDPGDLWGAFFLLAIDTHLRVRTGKPWHPLKHRLYKCLWEDAKAIKNPAQNIKGRIQQFKKAHPGWETSLALLESAYHRYSGRLFVRLPMARSAFRRFRQARQAAPFLNPD